MISLTAVMSMPETTTDRNLLDAWVSAGDRTALGYLFERWQVPAWRVAYRIHPREAEDAIQDGFMSAMRSAASCRGDPGPWLLAIVANSARMRARALARRQSAPPTAEDPMQQPTIPSIDAEAVRAVNTAVESLPKHERIVVQLRFADGLTPQLIAATLGISRIAVRMRLHRGLRRLRDVLATQGVTAMSLSVCLVPPSVSQALTSRTAELVRSGPAATAATGMSMSGVAMAVGCLVALVLAIWVWWPRNHVESTVLATHGALLPSPQGQPAAVPTIADTLALQRPFRFYRDDLWSALGEVTRHIPQYHPLKVAVATSDSLWTISSEPRSGTDQTGSFFWKPESGSCSVREALEHIARDFDLHLTMAGDTAVFHQVIDDQRYADMISSRTLFRDRPREFLNDPTRWAAMLQQAFTDTAIAEREMRPEDWQYRKQLRYEHVPFPVIWTSPARDRQGDPIAAAVVVDPGLNTVSRRTLATTTSLAQAVIAMRIMRVQPKPADGQLVVDWMTRSNLWSVAVVPCDDRVNRLAVFTRRWGLSLLEQSPTPAAVNHLAPLVKARSKMCGVPEIDDAVFQPWIASGGVCDVAITNDVQINPELVRSLRGVNDPGTAATLRSLSAHVQPFVRGAALDARLARGDRSAIADVLSMVDGGIDMVVPRDRHVYLDQLGHLMEASVQLLDPADQHMVAELVKSGLVTVVADYAARSAGARYANQALARLELHLWPMLLQKLDDRAVSQHEVRAAADVVLGSRDDAADVAYLAILNRVEPERTALLREVWNRHRVNPESRSVAERLRADLATSTLHNVWDIACRYAGQGEQVRTEMRRILADETQSAWIRGAMLVGLESGDWITRADIESTLRDREPYLRATAVWAVGTRRFGGQVEDMTSDGKSFCSVAIDMALADPAAEVRLFGIYMQRMDKNPTLLSLLARDPSSAVRSAAAHSLGMHLDFDATKNQAEEQALQMAAESDPDPEVRRACMAYVCRLADGRKTIASAVRTGSEYSVSLHGPSITTGLTAESNGVLDGHAPILGNSTAAGFVPREEGTAGRLIIVPPMWTEKPTVEPVSHEQPKVDS